LKVLPQLGEFFTPNQPHSALHPWLALYKTPRRGLQLNLCAIDLVRVKVLIKQTNGSKKIKENVNAWQLMKNAKHILTEVIRCVYVMPCEGSCDSHSVDALRHFAFWRINR